MPEGLKKIAGNSWLRIFAGFILLELISFAVFPSVWLSQLAFVLILLIAGALTAYKTEFGAYLLLAELVVGGLGYLITFPIGGERISLRIGLFALVFLIWLIKLIKKDNISRLIKNLKDWQFLSLGIFFIVFCLGIARGLMNSYPARAIFADFNGYLYLGLIGLMLTVTLKPVRLMQILLVGSFVLGLKTVLILFFFSHGYAVVNHSFIYTWIRDTGVGEITLIAAPLYRIFFQSQIYNLLALIFSVFILLIRPSETADANAIIDSISRSRWAKALLWLAAWFNFFVLVISQSRSFWVAGLATIIFIIPALAVYLKISWQRIVIFILLIPAFAIISNFAGQAIIGDFQTDFLTGRVSGETGSISVSSRLAELAPAINLIQQAPLLGHGFGTTIHFRSDDPRIKNQSNPEGWTDAAAIEWGYLDLAIKAGPLGLLAYLAFLFALAWSLIKLAIKKDLLVSGLLAGFLALMIVHMFTPYLNHPLGIGYLLVIVALTKKQ